MALEIHQRTSQTLNPTPQKISQGDTLGSKVEQTVIQTPSGIGQYYFKDSGVKLLNGATFQSEKVYFLKLKIKKPLIDLNQEAGLNITEALQNKIITFKLLSEDKKTEQFIQDYTIPFISGTEEDYSIVELIFKPLFDNFTTIGFILNRSIADLIAIYNGGEETVNLKVEFDLQDNENKLFEIRTSLSPSVLSKVVKIGVQGTPGLLMCVNGEGIRLGPSGMYQIKNGYSFNFLSFLLENDQQRFILDYESQV